MYHKEAYINCPVLILLIAMGEEHQKFT